MIVIITENCRKLTNNFPKTNRELKYRKLTLSLNLTLNEPEPYINPQPNLKPYTLIITEFSVSFLYWRKSATFLGRQTGSPQCRYALTHLTHYMPWA